MARQKKQGIDYFSLDCDFFSDKKIKILKITDEDEINNYLNKLFEILKKINNNDDLEKVDIYSVIERMEL